MKTENWKLKIERGLPGFTLIELLVVIAIIGILMGMVVVIIDPATILKRSRQGVAKANVARVCEAMIACYTAQNDMEDCDTTDEIGVTAQGGVTVSATTNTAYKTQDTCKFTCNPTANPPMDTSPNPAATGKCYVD